MRASAETTRTIGAIMTAARTEFIIFNVSRRTLTVLAGLWNRSTRPEAAAMPQPWLPNAPADWPAPRGDPRSNSLLDPASVPEQPCCGSQGPEIGAQSSG